MRVKEYEGGKLKEATVDYFAQRRDGAVIYFGQRVDNYRNGKVVAHRGEWIAGRKKAKRGLFMPANPKVGQVFVQERAPGIAVDRSTVLAVGGTVTTPAGTFGNCMKVRDYAVLDKVERDQVLLRRHRPRARRREARDLVARQVPARRLVAQA